MCSLFLKPEAAAIWNTYSGGRPWSDYRTTEAARTLGLIWPRSSPLLHRFGAEASLAAWHRVFDPVNRFGWIMVNSSGAPRQFSISGGGGIPADLPRGRPVAVSIIHSFSAADPVDPSTLAGRWLENGAYVYYGAMNEPYLYAFRCPKLVAELAAAEIPLSAAMRQGEHEPFSRPWRLVYLGDPLYRFRPDNSYPRQDRITPRAGQIPTFIRGRRTALEIIAKPRPLDVRADESARLQWCLTAALGALCQSQDPPKLSHTTERPPGDPEDWRSILVKIDRGHIELRLRPVLDELVTDTLLNSGDQKPLLEWLLSVPPAESSPRARWAIETIAMSRLFSLAASRSFTSAFDLWDELIRGPWPGPDGKVFLTQFTERLGVLVDADPQPARELYRQRLVQAARFFSSNPDRYRIADLVNEELKRLETAPARASNKAAP